MRRRGISTRRSGITLYFLTLIFVFLGAGGDQEYVPSWETLGHTQKHIKKYATTKHVYTVQCRNQKDVAPTSENVDKLLTSLVAQLTSGIDPAHCMGLSIQSPSLDYVINMPYCRIRDFKASSFLEIVQKVLNSNEDFAIDGRLKVELRHVEIPEGSSPDDIDEEEEDMQKGKLF